MIEILRLNHRIARDKRVTTHVGLTARALGAECMYYSGDKDSAMEESIDNITCKFGGSFRVEHVRNEIWLIENKKKNGYLVVHLTVYGVDFRKKIGKLKNKNIVIIVGGEKVENEYYKISDYNLSVTSQPISEVSAVGIFLYELNGIVNDFRNAKVKIVEQERGKFLKEI